MNKEKFSFFLVISLVMVSISIGYSQKGTISTNVVKITKADNYLTKGDINRGEKKTGNKMAVVKMSHDKHKDIKCITCHHKEGNDDRIKKCALCHKGNSGMEIMHELCIECHKEMKEGPIGCDDCHK